MRKLTSGLVSAQYSESVNSQKSPSCALEDARCSVTVDGLDIQTTSMLCTPLFGSAIACVSDCRITYSCDPRDESKRAVTIAPAIKYTTVTQVHINAPAHC